MKVKKYKYQFEVPSSDAVTTVRSSNSLDPPVSGVDRTNDKVGGCEVRFVSRMGLFVDNFKTI